jgi:Heavy metal associated domain 2
MRAEPFRAVPGSSENERLVGALAAAERHAGVTRAEANPFTGSLLVEYQPDVVEPGAILAAVAGAGGLAGVVDAHAVRRSGPDAGTAIIDFVKRVDQTIKEVSNGRAGLGTLVPAGLAASALFFLVRRPEQPRWDNLLYWSYSIFRDLHRDAIEGKGAPRAR